MKQKIINILSGFFKAIDALLIRLHLKRHAVVVYMDGGICSQMLMYLHGQYYAEKGMNVRYDTRWYDLHGKDQYGVQSRFFELTEMWPNLDFEAISNIQRKWYLLFFKAQRINGDLLPDPKSLKHSLYLNGYWDIPTEAYSDLFRKWFDMRTAAHPTRCDIYSQKRIVGVHVRRGDLAKGDNPIYGGVSDGYFLRAIEFCSETYAPEKYILFSDEPDWVEQNICLYLKQPYEIMRGNKAWEDLWYLAQCQIIIASQGSFGRVAARLNPDAILIQCDNEHADRGRTNTYFIK